MTGQILLVSEKSGKYLYDNGFTIYVVSGTERTTTRAIVANSLINDFLEIYPDKITKNETQN